MDYVDRKHGVNSWKVIRIMGYVMIPLCVGFTILALDTYVRVTEHEFIVNRVFSLEEDRYEFDELRKIELTRSFKAPIGSITRKPYYTFEFDDGFEYNFHRSMHVLSIERQHEIAGFLSEKSQTQITVSDPYPRRDR